MYLPPWPTAEALIPKLRDTSAASWKKASRGVRTRDEGAERERLKEKVSQDEDL